MSDNLIKKAEAARATRDQEAKELAALHQAMLTEMAESIPGGYTRAKYGTDLLRVSFEQVNRPVDTPEMVVESLRFYGSVCTILSPRNGESIDAHSARVREWIAEQWRRAGMPQ